MEQVQTVEFDDKAIEGLELLFHEFWILRSEHPQEYQLIQGTGEGIEAVS